MKVAVIGGGAAGYFAAINCKRNFPEAQVILFEKTKKTLSKVKISGGGRCNVTHDCKYISDLVKHYPRGGKKLKKVFKQFSIQDTITWFSNEGVELKVEPDGRMFPITDDSQTIIDALENARKKIDVQLMLSHHVKSIKIVEDGFELVIKEEPFQYDKIIIAAGGHPKISSYKWIEELGLTIIAPVPSLFTFNIPGSKLPELMGVVAEGIVRIPGTPFIEKGPVLITHWGISGPAVLKLSAWAARHLEKEAYQYEVKINWVPDTGESDLALSLIEFPNKKLKNHNPFQLPLRLWLFLLKKAEVDVDISWYRTPKSKKNKLLHLLSQDVYRVSGKTTFKEEFVTAGGISLEEVDLLTMQSHQYPGMYFAGEVLDIDAVTGGFNFQAAWSTGYVAAKLG